MGRLASKTNQKHPLYNVAEAWNSNMVLFQFQKLDIISGEGC